MERLHTPEQVRQALGEARRDGVTIGFVPTMGALHEGHLSLVRSSRDRADVTVVSIFVNPTQFAPTEDLDAYPRDIDHDLELLDAAGVDFVFTPSVETMYGHDATVTVDPGDIARRWEGESRPHHFGGVATVVTKLFNIVDPDIAFFGEKDYQQLKVIERLVEDLDIPVTIAGCPIVREADGLAMSSRNVYLSTEERTRALSLHSALGAVVDAVAAGECDVAVLEMTMAQHLERAGADTEYAVLVDAETLEPATGFDGPARAIIAAHVGTTRLIDNMAIEPPRDSQG